MLNVGSVFAIVDTSSIAFRHYSGGIIDTPECGSEANHAVTIVGYGNDAGVDYFLVRNSFGKNWGEDGYVRIASQPSSVKGICGIS